MRKITRNIGLIMLALMLTVFTGCKEFHFDDFQPGADGIDGTDGKDGADGLNAAMRLYVFGPDYNEAYPAGGVQYESGLDENRNGELDDEEVIAELTFIVANGLDGQNGVGAAPVIPVINEETGTWWINGVDTGYSAIGKDGENGENGLTPYVGENGNWWIGEVDTEVGAQGETGAPGETGKTGGTPYPFITEIPATPEHLNGGWMYTWYVLDETLQLTEESQFIGAYPIYNGNDGTDGEDGITPHVGENGYWWIGEYQTEVRAVGINGLDGADGAPGADGLTPYIDSETGTWWLGDYNTGVSAQGETGAQGDPGAPGANGLTPYIGENENWWIGGFDTGYTSTGTDGTDGTDGIDGKSPFIGENNYWYVWSDNEGAYINSGIYSIGEPGATGATGLQGEQGPSGLTPYIGDNGNWWIGDTDTGVNSTGADGADGADGVSPKIVDGYWYVWNGVTNLFINTYVSSSGADGAPGTDGDDGVGVDFISTEPTQGCGAEGGLLITVYLTDGSYYFFEVCNGVEGPIGPAGADGDDGLPGTNGGGDCNWVGDSPFCSGAYILLADQKVIDEGFNNESIPYSAGWSSLGSIYNFIPDQLVIKGGITPNEAQIITPDLKLSNLTEITVDATEYRNHGQKFIAAYVLTTSSPTWILLNEQEVTVTYHDNSDVTQSLTWSTNLTNVIKIRFSVRSDNSDHDHSKVIIDHISITGSEVICVQSSCVGDN